MNTLAEIDMLTEAVRNAPTIYMPKGKDVEACADALRGMGLVPPALSDDVPEAIDAEGRRYVRTRAEVGVDLLERGYGGEDGKDAVALVGSDIGETLIDSNPATTLRYTELGPPMATFELLLPQDAQPSLLDRLAGDGEPVRVVTSYPRMLARCALLRELNIVMSDVVPRGGTEWLVGLGVAEVAADLVTSGRTARIAGLRTSKTPSDEGLAASFDPVLRGIYAAVAWRIPGAEYVPLANLDSGIDDIDATLVERFGSIGDPTVERSNRSELLSSVQKALAKSTEEGLEMALAVLTGEGDAPTVAELADRVRADVLLVNSLRAKRGESPITYRAFLQELVNRNDRNPRRMR